MVEENRRGERWPWAALEVEVKKARDLACIAAGAARARVTEFTERSAFCRTPVAITPTGHSAYDPSGYARRTHH